jgi:hypothetical protein
VSLQEPLLSSCSLLVNKGLGIQTVATIVTIAADDDFDEGGSSSSLISSGGGAGGGSGMWRGGRGLLAQYVLLAASLLSIS